MLTYDDIIGRTRDVTKTVKNILFISIMRSRMREKAMLKTAVLWKEKKSCDNFRALLLLLLLLVVRLRLQMVVCLSSIFASGIFILSKFTESITDDLQLFALFLA